MKHMLATFVCTVAVLAGGGARAEIPKAHLCDPAAGADCACLSPPDPVCAASDADGIPFPLCLVTDADSDLLGWQIDIEGDAALEFVSFSPDPPGLGMLVDHIQVNPEGTMTLRINWVYDGDLSHWPSGTTSCIGTLGVNLLDGEGGSIHSLPSSMAVKSVTGADPELVSIDTFSTLVPEPSRGGLLVAGIALLLLLAAPGQRRRLSVLALLLAVGVGATVRAEVVAASRTLVDADLELVTTPELGAAMAAAGDLDGDGVDDLILGLPDADSGRGKVLLVALRRDGSVDRVWTIGEGEGGFTDSLDPGDAFGTAVVSLGDLNGDGVPDLAVAAPGANRTWVLLLRRGGATGTDLFVNHSRKVGLSGPVYALAAMGDVDSDGVPDLALGHPEFGLFGCGAGGSCGLVTILFLNSDGSPKRRSVFLEGAGAVPTPVSGDRFGASLAPLGDLDGNGMPDLAVGMPGYDSDRGSVALLLLGLPRAFTRPTGEATLVGDSSSSWPGSMGELQLADTSASFPATPQLGDQSGNVSVSVGDWEGDIDASNFIPWPVPVGGLRLDDTSAGFPAALQPGDEFGSALASVGDWEGNGTLDLVVGAPGRGTGGAGAVFLLPLEAPASGGGVHGTGVVFDSSAGELPDAFGADTQFGRSLTALNIDGDIDLDILVGAAQNAAGVHPGLAWELLLADSDGDGGPDAVADNCPDDINPGQLDTDGDGRGDVCDNCAYTANGPSAGHCTAGDPALLMAACSADADCNGSVGGGFCSTAQEDADLDGVGDVCEGAEVRLTGPHDPEALIPERHWKLELDCGAHNVTELALALFQPDLSLFLDLQFSGCEEPPFFGGLGCGAAGATPAPRVGAGSGAFRSDASGSYAGGSPSLAGLRPNTLYTFLEGASGPGSRLCDAFDMDVSLGWFGNPGGGLTDLSVAASQLELVGRGPGAMFTEAGELGRFCLRDGPAVVTVRSHTTKSAATTPAIAIDVGLASPAAIAKGAFVAELAPAAFQAWEVCFQSNEPLRRVKLAIEPPSKTDTIMALYSQNDLEWIGCDKDAPSPGAACTVSYGVGDEDLFYPVDELESEFHAPGVPAGGLVDDGSGGRIYPVLSGAKLGFDAMDVRLNATSSTPPYGNLWHCLGQVWVEGGAAKTAEAPKVFVSNESYLATLPPFCRDIPFGDPSCGPEADGTFAAFDAVINQVYCDDLSSGDIDGDGVREEADNCPLRVNPLQKDLGRLKAAAPGGRDEVGDACQCGEGDGDGIVSAEGLGTGDDLENLLKYLVGDPQPGFDESRCNLVDPAGSSSACNILDAVKLQQGLNTEGIDALPLVCDAFTSPVSDP